MKTRVYLLACAMLLQYSESLDKDIVHFGKWLQNSSDGSASVYTFEWIVKIRMTDCVEECKSTKACQYINYEVRTHLCALIIGVINNTNVAGVEKKPGYIFGNKSEWNMETFASCDMCASYGECQTGNWLENGYNMCRNSGCGIPRSTDFKGNMFSYGSRIRRNCTVQSICAKNGTWLDVPIDCLAFSNGSYYSLQTVPMTWNDSKAYCESKSGHLIDIMTEEEQRFLESFIVDDTWTGGNDWKEEGNFLWSDGSAVSDGYTAWKMANPDNFRGKEHCIVIILRRNAGVWNDYNCYRLQQSVCEFP